DGLAGSPRNCASWSPRRAHEIRQGAIFWGALGSERPPCNTASCLRDAAQPESIDLNVNAVVGDLDGICLQGEAGWGAQRLTSAHAEPTLMYRALDDLLIEVAAHQVRALMSATPISRKVSARRSIENQPLTGGSDGDHCALRKLGAGRHTHPL